MISIHTMSKLLNHAGESFFDSLILIYQPLHNAFVSLYGEWEASPGIQKGGTLNFSFLIDQLSNEKIKRWDVIIQSFYPRGTAEYMRLMPKSRGLFRRGTCTERVQAVGNLITAIGEDPVLTPLKIEVGDYYDLLLNARDNHLGKGGNMPELSRQLEVIRVSSSKGMFKILGKLIDHFYDDPVKIVPFFNLHLLQKSTQVFFTKRILKNRTVTIAKRTLEAAGTFSINNTGNIRLTLCISATKKGSCNSGLTVLPAQQVTVAASTLGDITTHHFIKVTNTDTIQEGHFELEIL